MTPIINMTDFWVKTEQAAELKTVAPTMMMQPDFKMNSLKQKRNI